MEPDSDFWNIVRASLTELYDIADAMEDEFMDYEDYL